MRRFQFESEEARDAYLESVRKPITYKNEGGGAHVDASVLSALSPLPVDGLVVIIPEAEDVALPTNAREVDEPQKLSPAESVSGSSRGKV